MKFPESAGSFRGSDGFPEADMAAGADQAISEERRRHELKTLHAAI
ncbi:hypothetical protein D3OALGA1CA_2890 [Olavius algarvensis associated proteobacterium Delta 3]|nr:hypothetical protein D3OALGB2SA_2724 [Olavius algarvensis associated proteobacterium Delta 3]CAB5125860.1 hypothetical protein D3OALGA1CA_2890 [Olavius algarvensis associated proteobacterium Delta 3]